MLQGLEVLEKCFGEVKYFTFKKKIQNEAVTQNVFVMQTDWPILL